MAILPSRPLPRKNIRDPTPSPRVPAKPLWILFQHHLHGQDRPHAPGEDHRHRNLSFSALLGRKMGLIPIPLFHHRFQKLDPFFLGFRRFSRKKDPWKEWKWKVPLEPWAVSSYFSRQAGFVHYFKAPHKAPYKAPCKAQLMKRQHSWFLSGLNTQRARS